MTPNALPEQLSHRIYVDPTSGCWLWSGALTEKGYGRVSRSGVKYRTHRLVWELLTGQRLLSGTDLHHLCPNRHCCNPDHLSLLGHAHHAVLTGHERHQGRCKNGHELTPENSYVRRRADGSFRDRQCRECRRLSR